MLYAECDNESLWFGSFYVYYVCTYNKKAAVLVSFGKRLKQFVVRLFIGMVCTMRGRSSRKSWLISKWATPSSHLRKPRRRGIRLIYCDSVTSLALRFTLRYYVKSSGVGDLPRDITLYLSYWNKRISNFQCLFLSYF